MFAAIKRGDSNSSTKRKVSSISASDASDHEAASSGPDDPAVFQPQEDKDPFESHLFDLPADDDHLEQSMPWLRVMTKLINRYVKIRKKKFQYFLKKFEKV
jgi:hypothetical protein